jgi:hypothetical protein
MISYVDDLNKQRHICLLERICKDEGFSDLLDQHEIHREEQMKTEEQK